MKRIRRQPKLDGLDDVELMKLAGSGRKEAFAVLVRRHQQPLYAFFIRSGASADAEDLVQETLIKLYKTRKNYRPKARFTTFLYTIARRVWIDVLRKQKRFDNYLAEQERETETGASASVAWSATDRLDSSLLLGTLSDRLRSVVVMRVFQGLSYAEIAEILEVPLGTVKSRMNLALNHMREQMQKESEVRRVHG